MYWVHVRFVCIKFNDGMGVRVNETTLCQGRWVETHNLFVQQFFQLFSTDIVLVQVKFKELGIERWCNRLVIRIVVCLQIRVGESIFDRDTLFWIKC